MSLTVGRQGLVGSTLRAQTRCAETEAQPRTTQAQQSSDAFERPSLRDIERRYQVPADATIGHATVSEGAWLASLGPVGAARFAAVTQAATNEAVSAYPTPAHLRERPYQWRNDDGHRNAFKHAYWNALMTRQLGAEWTRQFATAHERTPGNVRNREAMDLYNNEVGRQIALANPNATPAQLSALVQRAVSQGQLVVIPRSGQGLEWSDRVSLWQHGTAGVRPR